MTESLASTPRVVMAPREGYAFRKGDIMMITFPALLAAFVAATASASIDATGSAINELSAAQLADVQAGKQVLVEVPRAGAPWPELWTYQKLEATPEEAMAVAADYV